MDRQPGNTPKIPLNQKDTMPPPLKRILLASPYPIEVDEAGNWRYLVGMEEDNQTAIAKEEPAAEASNDNANENPNRNDDKDGDEIGLAPPTEEEKLVSKVRNDHVEMMNRLRNPADKKPKDEAGDQKLQDGTQLSKYLQMEMETTYDKTAFSSEVNITQQAERNPGFFNYHFGSMDVDAPGEFVDEQDHLNEKFPSVPHLYVGGIDSVPLASMIYNDYNPGAPHFPINLSESVAQTGLTGAYGCYRGVRETGLFPPARVAPGWIFGGSQGYQWPLGPQTQPWCSNLSGYQNLPDQTVPVVPLVQKTTSPMTNFSQSSTPTPHSAFQSAKQDVIIARRLHSCALDRVNETKAAYTSLKADPISTFHDVMEAEEILLQAMNTARRAEFHLWKYEKHLEDEIDAVRGYGRRRGKTVG